MENAIRFAFILKMSGLIITWLTFVAAVWTLITTNEINSGMILMAMLTMISFNSLADLVEAVVIAKIKSNE